MSPARSTKAQIVFFTGVNTWTATYLDVKAAAAVAVFTAAYLAWLAPNEEPEPWDPPEYGGDAGQSFFYVLGVIAFVWLLWVLIAR